jgi:hypothetical protein
MDFVVAGHGVRDTVEIANGILFLEADLDDPGPVAALEKTRHGAADHLGALAAAFLQKIRNGATDDLLVGGANKIGKADSRRESPFHGKARRMSSKESRSVGAGDDKKLVHLLVAEAAS